MTGYFFPPGFLGTPENPDTSGNTALNVALIVSTDPQRRLTYLAAVQTQRLVGLMAGAM